MKNLAIIPARGRSKRIPGKNIRPFLGKPIIAYAIETVIKSKLFSEVMVSTDDEEIAEVAKKYGAKVPFMRSEDNADDYATLSDVVDEVINSYSQMGDKYNYACCILPTSPLLTVHNLEKGLNLLTSKKLDSVKPVVAFSYPIQRALKLENGLVQMFHPEHKRTRSQDLVVAYHDAGQFYWFKFDKGLSGDNKGAIILKDTEVQDIDTLDDWKMAEIKYKLNG